MKNLFLKCQDKAALSAGIEKFGRTVNSEEELNMRGQYPSSADELANAQKFFGLEVKEDKTLPRDMVLLMDSHGRVIRQFRM